jgi:hypothetical protein
MAYYGIHVSELNQIVKYGDPASIPGSKRAKRKYEVAFSDINSLAKQIGLTYKNGTDVNSILEFKSTDVNRVPHTHLTEHSKVTIYRVVYNSKDPHVPGEQSNAPKNRFQPISYDPIYPCATVNDLLILMTADANRLQGKKGTSVRRSEIRGFSYQDNPQVDLLDSYFFTGGSLARMNLILARLFLDCKRRGYELTEDIIYNMIFVDGGVEYEQGYDGKASNLQSKGYSKYPGLGSTKLLTTVTEGMVTIYDLWGGNLACGTNLYLMIKKVPLPTQYILSVDPSNSSGIDPRRLGGDANNGYYVSPKNNQGVHPIEYVFQLIPWADCGKAIPDTTDRSYTYTITRRGKTIPITRKNAKCIKVAEVRVEPTYSYKGKVDRERASYDNHYVHNECRQVEVYMTPRTREY